MTQVFFSFLRNDRNVEKSLLQDGQEPLHEKRSNPMCPSFCMKWRRELEKPKTFARYQMRGAVIIEAQGGMVWWGVGILPGFFH